MPGGPAAVVAGREHRSRARRRRRCRRRRRRARAAAPGPGRPRRGRPGVALGLGGQGQGVGQARQRLGAAPGVVGQGGEQAHLDQAAGPPGCRRGLPEPLEEAERPAGRVGVEVGAVPGEEEPHQGEVVVLAQEHRRVGGRHLALARPVGRRRRGHRAQLEPGPQRRDRPHVGEEARAVELLGPVQVTRRRGVLAAGRGQQRRGHEQPEVALGHRRPVRERRAASRCCGPGRGRPPRRRARPGPRAARPRPGERLAVALGLPQRPVAELAGCTGRPAARHRSASTTWLPSSSTRFPAACRLATASPNVS